MKPSTPRPHRIVKSKTPSSIKTMLSTTTNTISKPAALDRSDVLCNLKVEFERTVPGENIQHYKSLLRVRTNTESMEKLRAR
jgi:hypothetical protein